MIRIAYRNKDLRPSILAMLRRQAKEYDGQKRMVIMIGPPASGKGFFLERGGAPGKGLPQSTQGLFDESHIPEEGLGVEESDNDLRAIQFMESRAHFNLLKKAHSKGQKTFNDVLEDMWYKTKDGDIRKLSDFVTYQSFDPKSHKSYHTEQASAFYQSMRGWHNDADEVNPETGKIKERFKDQARKKFEQDVRDKISDGKNMLIVDSAGEDIDAQDFEGQIAAAKAAGFEVTVIALDPDKEETSLANMARGFIFGKRMVDKQDIDNYYAKYQKSLERIRKANPHNFLHYKKPSLSGEQRKKLRKLMEETPDGKPTFLKDPSSKIRSINDLPEQEGKKVKKGVLGVLFAKEVDYKISTETSFTASGMPGLPENKNFKTGPKHKPRDQKKKEGPGPSRGGDSWLDQRVVNPETGNKVKIRTLKNKPKDSEAHKYYRHILKERQKASRLLLARKVASSYILERRLKMADYLANEMKDIASDLGKQVKKIDGYNVSVEPGKGPRLYVTLKGAEGDIGAGREGRQVLKKEVERIIKDRFEGALKHDIRVVNRRDDLILEVTFIFP